MSYIVTITSQGQITIPAKLRRKIGLTKSRKLSLREENGKVTMEPVDVPDLLSLAGSLKKYAIKGKSIDEVIKMEKEAWGNAVVEKYRKRLTKTSK